MFPFKNYVAYRWHDRIGIYDSMKYPLSDDDRLPLKDLVKNIDEIKAVEDIVNIWHIEQSVAEKVFSLLTDVISLPDTDSCFFDVNSEMSDKETDESIEVDDSTDDELFNN